MNATIVDLDLARKVARIAKRAGAAILTIYDSKDFGIVDKSDASPLTKADQAANEVINRGLKRLGLQWPIVSEENKAIPYATRQHFTTYWLVDPLDGTKEFIKRNGEFTVNIALVENGKVVLGVVYVPVSNEMYYAVQGLGTFRVANGSRKRLWAATYRSTDTGLNLVCSRSHLTPATETFIAQYREPNLVSQGSSLKFILVADGRANIYPRIAPTMEWDTAAAQILVEEAGGKVVQFESGAPVAYNKENLLNPFFVVYGRQID